MPWLCAELLCFFPMLCYSKGMSKRRTEKTEHQERINIARSSKLGHTGIEISSPREIAKRGRRAMTGQDYRELKMGRGSRQADVARELKRDRTHTHKQTRVY